MSSTKVINDDTAIIYNIYNVASRMGKMLVGKPEGKRPLKRPRCTWMDNIRMENRVGRRGLDSSGLGLGPVADACEHGNEPSASIKRGGFLD
jgi:hypothetical protein